MRLTHVILYVADIPTSVGFCGALLDRERSSSIRPSPPSILAVASPSACGGEARSARPPRAPGRAAPQACAQRCGHGRDRRDNGASAACHRAAPDRTRFRSDLRRPRPRPPPPSRLRLTSPDAVPVSAPGRGWMELPPPWLKVPPADPRSPVTSINQGEDRVNRNKISRIFNGAGVARVRLRSVRTPRPQPKASGSGPCAARHPGAPRRSLHRALRLVVARQLADPTWPAPSRSGAPPRQASNGQVVEQLGPPERGLEIRLGMGAADIVPPAPPRGSPPSPAIR